MPKIRTRHNATRYFIVSRSEERGIENKFTPETFLKHHYSETLLKHYYSESKINSSQKHYYSEPENLNIQKSYRATFDNGRNTPESLHAYIPIKPIKKRMAPGRKYELENYKINLTGTLPIRFILIQQRDLRTPADHVAGIRCGPKGPRWTTNRVRYTVVRNSYCHMNQPTTRPSTFHHFCGLTDCTY